MDILEKMFGSPVRARVMRAMVNNPEAVFEAKIIAKRARSGLTKVKRELNSLQKIGLVRKKNTKNEKGRKVIGYFLNPNFKYLKALREFFLSVSPMTEDAIGKKIAGEGRAKLIVLAGVFVDSTDSRADVLIVSDRPDEKKMEKVITEISSELGRDLSFALLSSEDFRYRMSMGDRLVRDIFDFPHRVILDRIGL